MTTAKDMATGSPVALKYWDGARWVGSTSATQVVVSPPDGPLKNIAAGCALMNVAIAPASTGGVLVAAKLPVFVDASRPVLAFDVIFRSETASTKDVVIQCAVARGTTGTPKPLTFAGSDRITVTNPGNGEAVTVVSDPAPLDIRAGEELVLYGHSGSATGLAPADQTGYTPGTDLWWAVGKDFQTAFNALRTEGGTLAARPTVQAARPARVVAPSDRDSWLLAGDSIIHFYRCHVQRWATHAQVPWAKNATGGGTHGSALSTFSTAYVPGVRAATMVFDELGINGPGYPDAMEYCRRMRAEGIRGIVKSTLTPRCSSSDNWATVQGQTPVNPAPYDAFDAWLLDGAPMKADWSAAAATGAEGPDIVRAAVVDGSGRLIRSGDAGHIFGAGGVVDWNPCISAAGIGGSRRVFRTDIGLSPADYGDGLHFGEGVHQKMAEFLIQAMPVLLERRGS